MLCCNMARLINLAATEEDEPESDEATQTVAEDQTDDRPNPNIGLFSAALSCYP